MKRIQLLLLSVALLAGCGSSDSVNNESTVDNSDEEVEEKKDEMSESEIMAYMDQMTGKYLLIDTYDDKSEGQQKQLDKALTEVNLAMLEIEDEYEPNIAVVKDLDKLAESIKFAINELLQGNYATKVDNSKEVGKHVGELSRAYLDGELPPIIKAVTGQDSAN